MFSLHRTCFLKAYWYIYRRCCGGNIKCYIVPPYRHRQNISQVWQKMLQRRFTFVRRAVCRHHDRVLLSTNTIWYNFSIATTITTFSVSGITDGCVPDSIIIPMCRTEQLSRSSSKSSWRHLSKRCRRWGRKGWSCRRISTLERTSSEPQTIILLHVWSAHTPFSAPTAAAAAAALVHAKYQIFTTVLFCTAL